MKKLKFAIFGCGNIADFHAAALRDVGDAELYACADVYKPAAEKYATKHGIIAHESFDDLLNDNEIDVINLCTPSGTHAELAIKALNSNKNVIVEKPMAISVEDCDKIIEAAKNSRAKIGVISQLRTSPDIIRARDVILAKTLGKIVTVELIMKYYRAPEYYKGSWRGTKKMDGGGALMNQGIHGVDILQYLLGPIKNYKSIVRTLVHDIEVEDCVAAAVEFENSAVGVILASTATHPGFERQLKINGTRGAIEIIEDKIVRLVVDGVDAQCEEFVSSGSASSNTSLQTEGHSRQFSAFVDMLNGKNVTYMDEHEGKKAVEIIESIYNNTI